MHQKFIDRCYKFFVEKANYYIANSTIGEDVKVGISRGWIIVREPNRTIFRNTHPQAHFVEFGVGFVGENSSHRNASTANYKYNVPSPYKYAGQYHTENTWRFYVDDEGEIDLQKGTFEPWETSFGDYKIITEGSPATMYAFNALMELKAEYKKIWQQIKQEFWG